MRVEKCRYERTWCGSRFNIKVDLISCVLRQIFHSKIRGFQFQFCDWDSVNLPSINAPTECYCLTVEGSCFEVEWLRKLGLPFLHHRRRRHRLLNNYVIWSVAMERVECLVNRCFVLSRSCRLGCWFWWVVYELCWELWVVLGSEVSCSFRTFPSVLRAAYLATRLCCCPTGIWQDAETLDKILLSALEPNLSAAKSIDFQKSLDAVTCSHTHPCSMAFAFVCALDFSLPVVLALFHRLLRWTCRICSFLVWFCRDHRPTL